MSYLFLTYTPKEPSLDLVVLKITGVGLIGVGEFRCHQGECEDILAQDPVSGKSVFHGEIGRASDHH